MWFGSSVVECRDGIPEALGSNPGRARCFFTTCYKNSGAKFYSDCAEIKNGIFQFSVQACREKFYGVDIYTRTVLSKLVNMSKIQFCA